MRVSFPASVIREEEGRAFRLRLIPANETLVVVVVVVVC